MQAEANSERRADVEGCIELTCGDARCEIEGVQGGIRLTASSLPALRKLTPKGGQTIPRALGNILRRTGCNIEVRIGQHLVARMGPGSPANRLGKVMGFDGQVFPWNVLRAKLGL
ncbi:MAG: hypothetical protein DHS20C16_20810 [Phycisphaerae bacterium]|nr:MAG: hypothetical protein DHS20C16_20810 [Phycisphaerae bacterium]